MARWDGGFFSNLLGNRRRVPPPRSPPRRPRFGALNLGPGPPPGHGPPPPGQRPVPAPVRRPQIRLQNATRPTREKLRELAQIEATKIQLFFEHHRHQFEYVQYLSNGITGVSCKVRIKNTGGRTQYFVVKRALQENKQLGLERELRTLELLRGSQHILQLFYIPSNLNNPLIDAPGLTIFTEWIESGTLRDFLVRIMDQPRPLPNRMLLEFFKCHLQMRLGKEQIAHRDMHVANVMIGSLNPEGGGHDLVPILKLIDFDQARDESNSPGVNTGVLMNIRDIGDVMHTIITGDLTMSPRPGRVTVTICGSARTFFTQGADLTAARYANLDPEMAALVQWCLASPIDRPSLELLDESLKDLRGRATPNRRGHRAE
ncbi:hypothetical protein CIB48_g2292 [Xylaria polymorpha]|nr:hypothetical protein CIB48_g2292 [Xylaria polymorpha]